MRTTDKALIAARLRYVAGLPQPYFGEVPALETYAALMGFYTDPSPGEFTDDEARLALCLAANVIECGDFIPRKEWIYDVPRPSQVNGEAMSRAIPNARWFFRVLRALGFSLDYDTVAGGGRTVGWTKTVLDRKLDLQLSDDGEHRVSHFLNGRMSTLPVYFTDSDDMICAIANELTRTDHPPRL